ncbi:hypothetical protein [Psychromarinibacter sp. S121]|uniref:hypothetical protein n=1 Tax=Psychromarinibacter sp. S121 TaxID=3415127 RepID=UPI003C7D69D3
MDAITVFDAGRPVTFTFADIMRYHGPGFPGGVVHGLKAMQAAFPLLSDTPPERREINLLTAFTGPGGRDAIELVTRAVTDGRMSVDRSLGGKNVIDELPGPYLWRFTYRGRTVQATIRPGHVREEFVRLGATPDRSAEQEERLTALKSEMAERLLPLPAPEVYACEVVEA